MTPSIVSDVPSTNVTSSFVAAENDYIKVDSATGKVPPLVIISVDGASPSSMAPVVCEDHPRISHSTVVSDVDLIVLELPPMLLLWWTLLLGCPCGGTLLYVTAHTLGDHYQQVSD